VYCVHDATGKFCPVKLVPRCKECLSEVPILYSLDYDRHHTNVAILEYCMSSRLSKAQQTSFDKLTINRSAILDRCTVCPPHGNGSTCIHDQDMSIVNIKALSTIFKNAGISIRQQDKIVDNGHKALDEYLKVHTSGRAPGQELSSWHLSSGKHNTEAISEIISFLCYQDRHLVSAQDMLTEMLYLANEDLAPQATPAAFSCIPRVAFISRVTEISRLGSAQLSGRCENPICSNAISIPLVDIQQLVYPRSKFLTCSHKYGDQMFTPIKFADPKWQIAIPGFLETVFPALPVSLLDETDDYALTGKGFRMEGSDLDNRPMFQDDKIMRHLLTHERDTSIEIESRSPTIAERDQSPPIDAIMCVGRDSQCPDGESDKSAGLRRKYRRVAGLLERYLADSKSSYDVRYVSVEDSSPNCVNLFRVNDGMELRADGTLGVRKPS